MQVVAPREMTLEVRGAECAEGEGAEVFYYFYEGGLRGRVKEGRRAQGVCKLACF